MDAELPNIDALVELARGLRADPAHQDAAFRVDQQLDEAATRFAAIADQVVEAVGELVAEPDIERVCARVAVLREQFPLLLPLSTLFGAAPAPA